MNSIVINFDNILDINTAYNQLKKLYPKNKIAKTAINFEEFEDEYLLALAEERLANNRPLISHEDIWQRLGVTDEDLENVEADEFE